jgi:hypothetical protein
MRPLGLRLGSTIGGLAPIFKTASGINYKTLLEALMLEERERGISG